MASNLEQSINYKELANTDLQIEQRTFVNEVIYWCREFGFTNLTNLKLQKLLYYCYAIALKQSNGMPFPPLLKEKNFYGEYSKRQIDFWQYGPVMPLVYHELKFFGRDIIANSYNDYQKVFLKTEIDKGEYEPFYAIQRIRETESTTKVIDAIKYTLIALSDYTTNRLVNMTHSDESAWRYFYEQGNADSSYKDELILEKIIDEVESFGFFKTAYIAKKDSYDQEK